MWGSAGIVAPGCFGGRFVAVVGESKVEFGFEGTEGLVVKFGAGKAGVDADDLYFGIFEDDLIGIRESPSLTGRAVVVEKQDEQWPAGKIG